MSWLARSIVNSLKLDDDEENDDDSPRNQPIQSSETESSRSGVKDDLSELTKTLTRNFWGVASFLAPTDPIQPQPSDQIADSDDPDAISGIRSDLAEIGGRFKTGISKLSSNIAVSEITKMASNFLQFGSDDEDGLQAVGVTEEVVSFARDIALRPDTWLEFPLPDEEDDDDDFDMSDAQQEHALAVERLAPELTAIRIEICPGYMSEAYFWMIYFLLLQSRLDKHDAEILSTPQIVKARAMLMSGLNNRNTEPEPEWSANGGTAYSNETEASLHKSHLSVPLVSQSESLSERTSVIELTHPDPDTEIKIIDKSIVKELPANQTQTKNDNDNSEKSDDDADDWLKEETSEIGGITETTIPIGDEEDVEDVSFSDLEEDDEDIITSHKKMTDGSDSSTKDAREWVQLSRSSTDSAKEIDADDIDVM